MYIFLFYIIIGFLVLTSTLVMTLWFKTNRILNFYLIFTSIALCYYLIAHGLNNCKLIEDWTGIWSLNYYQIVLILTPSVYLFFEKLISNCKYPERNDILFFILPVFVSFLLKFDFFHYDLKVKIGFLFLFGMYSLFYIWKSYCLLKPYLWNVYYETDIFSPIIKNWANFIFKMMLLVKIHFFIFFISNFFVLNNYINLIIEAGLLIVFLIGYFKVVFSPLLLYGGVKLEQVSNDSPQTFVNKVWTLELNKRISSTRDIKVYNIVQDKTSIYIEQIEKIALVNCSFRKCNYSINDLSLEIGLPKYYLEFIFKYYCKVSFNDYKKIVRVFDAVNLINEGYLSSNTLDSLSRHVGFASYNPFLINFKEIVGIPPFDYYKKKGVVLNKNT